MVNELLIKLVRWRDSELSSRYSRHDKSQAPRYPGSVSYHTKKLAKRVSDITAN